MTKQNKIIISIFAILVIVGVIVGISKNKKVDNNRDEKIRIGIILPMTGPLAKYGEVVKNGINLALKDSKSNKITFIFEDSGYEPIKAVTAFNKLKNINNVDLIVNWGDPTSDAIALLIEKNNIPFIAFSTNVLIGNYSKNIVRTYNPPSIFADKAWEYFRAHNQKNIGILKIENPFFNGIVQALKDSKNKDESVLIIDNYQSPEDYDFRTTLLKIKNNNIYDTIGVFLLGTQISEFYKQKENLDIRFESFGTDQFEDIDLIKNSGEGINGAFFINYDVSNKFKENYKKEFKNDNFIGFAGIAYDVGMAISQIENKEEFAIMATFKNLHPFESALNSFEYKESGNDKYFLAPYYVKIINNGEIEVLK